MSISFMRLMILFPVLAALCRAQDPIPGSIAPYVPTPNLVVMRMLGLAELRSGEKMFDLGSGDGRLVLAAAEKFGADATGVEIDPDLVRRSRARIVKAKLTAHARIIEGDLLQQDYRSADVVTVYLYPEAMEKLRPVLEAQLKKGARVVAHDFGFEAWKPERIMTIPDDGAGRSRTLFLYKR